MPDILHREIHAIEVSFQGATDKFDFFSGTITEELGRLFQMDLELLNADANIDFEDVLGKDMTIMLELPEDQKRLFHGFVSRFSLSGAQDDRMLYHATLHPWLWFLTRRANCRIFQDKNIPTIIKEIFNEYASHDFDEALSLTYPPLTYCVQYRETDFNFVSRLMEQAGIYYYFKHEETKHTLVLSDAIGSHETFQGYEKIPFYPPDEHLRREEHHIHEWIVTKEVQPGTYTLKDFDFEHPKADLIVKSSNPKPHALSDKEIFDYPGKYTQTNDGDAYAKVRLEERQAQYEQAHGQANARGLCVGSLFELENFPREDQNREYLVVSARYILSSTPMRSGSETVEEDFYTCTFTAVPSPQQFRTPSRTPKPIVQGPQTAIVVGNSGDEINTDKYGRVKVQFHWDRYGQKDHQSSCWVRVAQTWAGSKWGSIQIPRIGQEVIVDFLEGDPDQPIITGRVYNLDNMPPYALPDEATRSGIKTHSSKEGDPNNFNELRFEDKKGEEQIYFQAEKDFDLRIKNDRKEYLGNDSHLIVKKDQLKKIEGDCHAMIKGNRNEKITGTVSLKTDKDMQEKVGLKYGLDAGMEIHLKAGMNVVLEAGMSITLKAGGGFIVVGPAGVTLSGTPVLINSGGSAGKGSGCSPENPKEALEASKGTPVDKNTVQPTQNSGVPPPPPTLSPQAKTFKKAAASGAPLCDT